MMNTAARSDDEADDDRFALARSLLDSYSSAAERGIAALDTHDLDALEAALRERRDLIPELEPLLEGIEGPTRHLWARSLEARSLEAKVRAAQKLDTRLTVALGAELQRVSHELGLLDEDEAVRSAYGQTRPTEGRKINLVR
jgi:hypothetical protein